MAEKIEDRIRRLQGAGGADVPVGPTGRPVMVTMPPEEPHEISDEDRRQMIEVRAGVVANPIDLGEMGIRPNIPQDQHRRAAEQELVERGDLPPVPAQPKAPPPAPKPAPREQGILPGEEQVTTADTFRNLPPPMQAGLRRMHKQSGGKDDFDTWLSQNFGELSPEGRMAAMQEAAPAAAQLFQPKDFAPKPALTPEQQANMARRRQRQYAREVGNRYSSMLSPQEAAYIDQLADADGGMQMLRDFNEQLRRRYERDRHRQVRDRAANYNLSQDLRSPNYAPGMGVRSLIEAVRSGNSEMAGAVYDVYGNPVAGGQSRQLAAVKARALADQQAAQIEADNAYRVAQMRAGEGDAQDPLKMQVLSEELSRALAEPDPVRRHQSVRTVIAMNPANQGMTAPEIEAEVQRTIASHMAQQGTPEGRDHAMRYLHSLKGNRDQFMAFAIYSLNMDDDTAKQAYDEATKARSWEDFGRDWGHWAAGVPANVSGAVGGATRGFVQGRSGPQQ